MSGKPIAASDHLNKLAPFMYDQNLMQLKARLRQAEVNYDMKLARIARKLIEDAHKKTILKERSMFAAFCSKIIE